MSRQLDDLPESAIDDVTEKDRCAEFLFEYSKERDFIALYIRSLLPNASDAEDVLQRCSLLLWQKFEQFDRERSFRAWACGVAYYEVRNFVRSAHRNRLQFNADLMQQIADQRLSESQERVQHLDLLKECMSRLKPEDQELMLSAYDPSDSLQALADSRRMTVRSLSTRIWRLKRLLLECVHRKLSLEETDCE